MKEHFILLARYNAWANRRVYDAAASVSPQALDQDVGAYGGSIIATLNHLLLVDRNWLAQLSDGGEAADTLDEVLFDDLAELREVILAERSAGAQSVRPAVMHYLAGL